MTGCSTLQNHGSKPCLEREMCGGFYFFRYSSLHAQQPEILARLLHSRARCGETISHRIRAAREFSPSFFLSFRENSIIVIDNNDKNTGSGT